MYCLDWQEQDLELYGTWRSGGEYAAIDIIAAPCGMRYRTSNGTVIEPREDCNWNKKAIE